MSQKDKLAINSVIRSTSYLFIIIINPLIKAPSFVSINPFIEESHSPDLDTSQLLHQECHPTQEPQTNWPTLATVSSLTQQLHHADSLSCAALQPKGHWPLVSITNT